MNLDEGKRRNHVRTDYQHRNGHDLLYSETSATSANAEQIVFTHNKLRTPRPRPARTKLHFTERPALRGPGLPESKARKPNREPCNLKSFRVSSNDDDARGKTRVQY